MQGIYTTRGKTSSDACRCRPGTKDEGARGASAQEGSIADDEQNGGGKQK